MDDKSADITYQKGQLIGQYKIIEILKQGRHADTFLGKNQYGKAPVVIRVFRPPLLSELLRPFLTQARLLIELEHPHILRVRDMGVDGHYPFLVSDYMPHLTLRQAFPHGSIAPLARFLPYLKSIASALQYAHDRNVLHRDIRPEHILLDRNNQILLSDFALEAIITNSARLNYQSTAAAAYTAPEVIQGKPVPASDQYSLAIVIYELLSGSAPFTQSYLEIANQHLHTPPAPLREHAPDVSARVEKIVMTALTKDPAKRFTTIRAFVNALEQEQNSQLRGSAHARISAPAVARQPISPSSAPVPLPPVMPMQLAQTPPYSPPPPAPLALHEPIPPMPPPGAQTPAFEESPLAPRREKNSTITRRAFTLGLVGLAAAGGAGGWYVLSKRLAKAVPPGITPGDVPPATLTTIDNTNVLIYSGHLASVNSLTWSPDGRLIASASDDTFVQIFDASSGRRRLIYSGHTEEVAAVSWAPNGKFIVSGSQDGSAQVWQAANGGKIFSYEGHTQRVNGVSWSSDNALVASGSEDKTVQVWNATSGAASFNFQGHTAGVLCVGWQPGNGSVASGSWDGTLRDWATLQHGDHFNAGDQIFSYDGHGKNEVYALAWSPDGNFIVSAGADQTVQISNGDDGTPRPPFFTGHRSSLHINPVRSVAWSPDGNFIASGDTNGIVYVWRVAGRRTVFTYRGHKGTVNALAWSPDGKRIASASADTTVHIWQPS